MHYETLTYDLTDGVAVVTLNRPEKMNAPKPWTARAKRRGSWC